MEKCWFVGVLSVVCGAYCLLFGVEGYPTEDLVVRLPRQPKVDFNQYAGYVDIDVKHGKSLFYYFVEADHDPHNKPLTLWLNGGPGCSSIGGGAFTELGPFYPNGDGHGLRKNLMSWNRASNLLFVDSPIGTGWSYSNTTTDYITGDASAANDMILFMLKWYEKFPSLRSRELFLSGESYAGHFIPQLANVVLDYNANSTGFKFTMKGVAIGNPLLKWVSNDLKAKYELLWSHGMISDEVGLTLKNCDSHDVSKSCEDARSEVSIGSYIDDYDIILDVCYPSIAEQEMRLKKMATKSVDVCIGDKGSFYLRLPEVQKALHANHTNLPYEWKMCNEINHSIADRSINILPILKRIVQNNISVWVFSGDQDSIVPFLETRTLVRELAHDLKFKITVPYRTWFSNGQVGGWVTEYGNLLTFATVKGAGHMVPYTQPSKALSLFNSFVRGMRLPNTTRSIFHS